MVTRRRLLTLFAVLLVAGGASPLQAQFVAKGCPQGLQGPLLNSFTAGTQGNSQFCLVGNGFTVSGSYNVQLTSPLRTFTALNASGTSVGIAISVPATFVATVSNPNQPDPVLVTVTSSSPGGGSANFAINPPLRTGGPVFVGGVGNNIAATLYTGGTAPYLNGLINGQGPPGIGVFPQITPVWTGTPSQTGTYQFTMSVVDAWGNATSADMAFYIVPKPAVTNGNPLVLAAGSPDTTFTINGSGFVSPVTINGVAEPGSLVQWTPPAYGSSLNPAAIGTKKPAVGTPQLSAPVLFTPTSITPNLVTVVIPASYLTATGYYYLGIVNPGNTLGPDSLTILILPAVKSLSFTTRTAGASPVTLLVTGAGFVNGSVVYMGSTPLPTTYIDATHLSAKFPTVNTPGVVGIQVFNPDETSSQSNAVVTILPAPTLTAIGPSSVNSGAPGFQMKVTGTNFLSSTVVYFNSGSVTTTFVNANQLTASIPASALTIPGTVPVTVVTFDGYITQALPFQIISTVPPLQLSTFSPLPSGVVNSLYNLNIVATGGVTPYTFSILTGSLPAGLKLSTGGVISGTPTTVGSSKFTLQVADSGTSTFLRDYSMSILAAPLSLTTPALSNVLQNTPLSVQFAANGGQPPYSFIEFGALPAGLTFSSSGLLSGTVTQAGTFPFLVFVNDSSGASASGKYSITVGIPGVLITPPSPLPPGQIGVPYTTQLAATGGTGSPYTWGATGLPSGLNIANNTGLIAGIPRESGTFTVVVTAGDNSGKTVTQSYPLVIATSKLTITTQSLSNGAVGSSYSATVAASGGSGTATFTATGLPAGVSLTATGILTGSPTTAGTFTVTVTATDSQGQTATAPFTVTIAPKLVVTGATISNAVLGTAITATKLAATGGTPPYQWLASNPAPGLNLALDGTLSGTPTTQGTFSFTVFVVDNSGSLSSGTVQVTVALPAAPTVNINGLPATNQPATQPSVQVALANPYPVTMIARLTLTFKPDTGADDPAVQFSTGGRTAQIVVPAGSTGGLTQVGLQTGTVAGTITVTAQLLVGSQDVTPSPAPNRAVRVNAGPPVITAITATRTSTGLNVVVTGFSSPRDVATGTFQFAGSTLANLQTTQVSVPVGPIFTTWFGSAVSAAFGSQFSLTQPFTVTGDTSTILTVTVTLTNSSGASQPFTANFQ